MPLSKIDNIVWTNNHGVPIKDFDKLAWVKRGIEFLKNNPDQHWTGTSSGDTYIQIRRCDDFYDVCEYQPRRYALIERDPNEVSACSCDIATINSKGCQCGGV